MDEQEQWEAKRQRKAAEVRAMYAPLEPGQHLVFRQGYEDLDGFRSYYPPDWETGHRDGKLRVLSGTPGWGCNVNGKRATVIRHLAWDGVRRYHPDLEKCNDYNRAMEDPDYELVDPYQPEPNFEWYEVECDGQRLHAGRWHVCETEEERQRREETDAQLDALVAEFQRETEQGNVQY